MTSAPARPFRFGVTNSRVGRLATWTDAAQRAEQLGYATFLVPDTVHTAAPFSALAAAAAATRTLHVGTWVVCEPLRRPELLAWEVATLHELLAERFELGLGAGRPGADHDAMALGEPFGTPRERVDRLMAAIGLLRDRVPGQALLVAASGPRLLALAGRTADSVALGWPPDTDIATAYERVAAVSRGAQGRADHPELAAGLVAVGEVGVPYLTRQGTDPRLLAAHNAVTVVTGGPRAMADQLLRRRDALGVSYFTVPSEAADEFAPVVELLAGR